MTELAATDKALTAPELEKAARAMYESLYAVKESWETIPDDERDDYCQAFSAGLAVLLPSTPLMLRARCSAQPQSADVRTINDATADHVIAAAIMYIVGHS